MKAASSVVAALVLIPSAADGFAALAPSLQHRPTVTSTAASSARGIRIASIKPAPRLSLSTPSSSNSPYASPELDTAALLKYTTAALTQLSLFAVLFASLDRLSSIASFSPPAPLTALLFYALSLKSRVLNPLNNARPDRSKALTSDGATAGFRDRIMPSWTPPGVVFPIMWLLIIGPLRAYSSSLVVNACGSFLSWPVMAFCAHLTLGDVWNTINNAERRYGASVVGVLMVLGSAVNAAVGYGGVVPRAGKLLGVTCVWLTVASALIVDTWRLNPTEINGTLRRVPLYPVKGEAKTGFLWFRGVGSKDAGADGNDDKNASGPGCKRLVDYDVADEIAAEDKVTYRNRAHLLKSKGII